MGVIQLAHVSYVYEKGTPFEKSALEDFSLTIEKGEYLGIIGATGSGKSTLVKLFNGLLKPTSGIVTYDGVDIQSASYDRIVLRGKVGLVFQYPEHQLFEETVLKDVMFGPKNLGKSEEEAKVKAKESLALVGLDKSYWKRSPFALSGGEKRRVALAGVLAMEPEVLVLDEPAAGLDPKMKKELFALLQKLNGEGKTIVVVSHSLEDMAEYATRIIRMEKGALSADGKPADVFIRQEEKPETLEIAEALRSYGYTINEKTIRLDDLVKEICRDLT